MDSFWRRLATRSQSNLYFALVFLPADRREAFRDVYRFLRAADDVADAGLPPDEALRGLAVFSDELEAVYAGRAEHPIAASLAEAVRRFDLPRRHFETILAALAEDVRPRRFATYAELEAWCEAVSGTLGALCLHILGVHGPAADAYARDVGIALQLANLVRDVHEDAARGRLYLPMDDLAAAGVREADVLAGRYTPGFAVLAGSLARRASGLVARARARLSPRQRRQLLVPEIWADIYLEQLSELKRGGFDVFRRRPYLRRRRKVAIALARWLKEERSRVAEFLFPHAA